MSADPPMPFTPSITSAVTCPRCNKRTYRDDAHTCVPPALLAEYERQIEALRSAVKGCGYHMASRYPFDCGEDDGISIHLCAQCAIDEDMAIRNLIGVTNG